MSFFFRRSYFKNFTKTKIFFSRFNKWSNEICVGSRFMLSHILALLVQHFVSNADGTVWVCNTINCFCWAFRNFDLPDISLRLSMSYMNAYYLHLYIIVFVQYYLSLFLDIRNRFNNSICFYVKTKNYITVFLKFLEILITYFDKEILWKKLL